MRSGSASLKNVRIERWWKIAQECLRYIFENPKIVFKRRLSTISDSSSAQEYRFTKVAQECIRVATEIAREENFDKQDFCAFLTWGMQWTSAKKPPSPEEIEVSEIDNL